MPGFFNYREQFRYIPAKTVSRLQGYSMNSLQDIEQNRLFHNRYSKNQMRLKSLTYSDPALPKDLSCVPKSFLPSHIPVSYQKFDERQYQSGEYFYPPVENVINGRPSYNDHYGNYVDLHNKKNEYNSIRSHSKPKEKTRRKLSYSDVSLSWDSNLQHAAVSNDIAESVRSVSRNGNNAEFYNSRYPAPLIETCPRAFIRCDSSQGPWQDWQWPSHETQNIPTVLSPSSPLDSGLSSQSVTSSPSLEIERAQMQRSSECGSPLPYMRQNQAMCSCSTNSVFEPKLLSPPVRSDSGRSSPWTQSAVSRLNALTQSRRKIADFPQTGITYLDPTPTSPESFDSRRFSMSGVYVSNSKANQDKSNNETASQNGTYKSSKKQIKKTNPVKDYNYESTSRYRMHSPMPFSETRADQSQERFQQLRIDTRPMSSLMKRANLLSPNDDFLKSPEPESTLSIASSDSPTLLSSPGSTKSDSESHKPKRERKKSDKQSDKAICELEEIYKRLNLNDYDLLDRAERRDLPTKYQNSKNINTVKNHGLIRSKSDSFYEILGPEYCSPFKKPQRAPPNRRSGIPDRIADDMALRKWRKASPKPERPCKHTTTYMLCSSHFTPTVSAGKDFLFLDQPDVEHDDLSYRKYFRMNGVKIDKPQPPFGIPLKPLPPQSLFSDYLHVLPSNLPQNLCHPRGNPDLVRDDMAYRTLRKDHLERLMYDSVSLSTRKSMKT